jgi:hypothetical protein
MKTNGSGGIASPFLTSALDGGEWSASRPGRFAQGERAPDSNWIGGWMGPRAGLNAVEKRKSSAPQGIKPRPSSLYQLSYPGKQSMRKMIRMKDAWITKNGTHERSWSSADWQRAGCLRGRSLSPGNIFPFSMSSRPVLGPTQPPTQWVPGAISQRAKAAGAWSWPLTSQLVPWSRIRGSVHPLPHTLSWCSV